MENSVKNVEADPTCPIRSDHFPILTVLQVKLKADVNKNIKIRAKFEKFEEQKRYDYNKILKQEFENPDWRKWMENAGETLPKIKAKRDKPGVSQHMQDLIEDRWKAVEELDIEKAKELLIKSGLFKAISKAITLPVWPPSTSKESKVVSSFNFSNNGNIESAY